MQNPRSSAGTREWRSRWSETIKEPSLFRRCRQARRDFISSPGENEISLTLSGSHMNLRKYSSSEMLVTRSMTTPTQSMLTPYWKLVPGWNISGLYNTSDLLPEKSSIPIGRAHSHRSGLSNAYPNPAAIAVMLAIKKVYPTALIRTLTGMGHKHSKSYSPFLLN